MPKFVFFDHGGTLAKVTKDSPEIVLEVLQEADHRFPLEVIKGAIEEAERDWAERYKVRGNRWNDLIGTQYYQEVLGYLGLTKDQRLASKIHLEWHGRAKLEVFPDTIPCLEALHQTRLPMGIITQTILGEEEFRRHHLRRFNLEHYFSVIVTTEDAGYDKPDPRLFQRALQLSRSLPDETIHVGDTYERDVVGAKAAGIRAIFIDRLGGHEYPDCEKISALTELPKLIEES